MKQFNSFYKTNDAFKFARQNVVYVAYVGKYNNQDYFKYGVSTNIFQREYEQHRKNFDHFEMCLVKKAYNMYQAEDYLEKELKLRNLHRHLEIRDKKQTELFVISEEYDYDYVRKLVNRVIRYADKEILYEMNILKKHIKTLEAELKRVTESE
jgi:hypothetical protein|uniref:Bacteriophage T5 Orf172 DNA-binding domain-containing protein n=1 Tax=viral metagenome TaxID=1070528 RepID=A0A6C0BGT1_9ZZZZ